jgi:hypothetical protein
VNFTGFGVKPVLTFVVNFTIGGIRILALILRPGTVVLQPLALQTVSLAVYVPGV